MKKQFRKVVYPWQGENDFAYEHVAVNQCRRIRTFPERRQWVIDRADEDLRNLGVYPRGRRAEGRLNPWNDFIVQRNWGKSWKDFTRYRKQWMVGDDAPPLRKKSRYVYLTGWVFD